MQTWFAELIGLIRWGWSYTLPKVLQRLFAPRWVQIVYGALLVVFGILCLLLVPAFWGDFLRNILVDQWTRVVGPDSAPQALAFLQSFDPRVVLVALVVLGAAWLWSDASSRFLQVVEEELSLPVVRGAGDRKKFIGRILPQLSQPLALGAAAQVLPYQPTPLDAALRQAARALRRQENFKGLILSAPSGAGKTRSALELIADLQPPLVVVWKPPLGADLGSVRLPVWGGSVVFLADGLNLETIQGQASLPAVLERLLQNCQRGRLIATIREEYMPAEVRQLRSFKLTKENDPQRYVELAKAVARAESQALGRAVTEAEVLARFDGYPGSLVVGEAVMKGVYTQLPAERRGFLQAGRLLYELGLRRLTLKRLWRAYAAIFGNLPDAFQQEEIPQALEKAGFCTLERGAGGEVKIHDRYLDKVIEPHPNADAAAQALWQDLQEARDWAAFFEIGWTWYAQATMPTQRDPQPALGRAIAAYQEALRYRTPEAAPLDYATTQNNLGLAYSDLAGYAEPQANLQNAIACSTRALAVHPQYAPAYRNRAVSSIRLGELEAAEADCQAAERLAPDHPFTHACWGWLYYARSEYPAAEERFRRAKAQFVDETEFNFELALVLLRLGRVDEALQAIRLRLEAHPPYPGDLWQVLPDFEALAHQEPEAPGAKEALRLLKERAGFGGVLGD